MTSSSATIVIGGVFAWSIYRRIRRNIGEQKLRPRRIITSLVIFALIGTIIVAAALKAGSMDLVLGFGGGLLLGAGLGFFGLRLTKFRTTDEGHFYTPNTYIGGALSVLLIGRIIYRAWKQGGLIPPPGTPPPLPSPLTYFIIGLTFGYYIVYYIGLFVHTHDKKPPVQKPPVLQN
jgi:hypothetical protein